MLALGVGVHAAAASCSDGPGVAAYHLRVQRTCACAPDGDRKAYRRCARDEARAAVAEGVLARGCLSVVRRCAHRVRCDASPVPCCRRARRGRVRCSTEATAEACATRQASGFCERALEWSGHRWRVGRADVPVNPGRNYFSDSAENVFVDDAGRLHLRVVERDGRFTCASVTLERSLGYGEYAFQLASRVDDLDPRIVAAGFTYESDTREIDVEFSRAFIVPPENAQYVVQPILHPGNVRRFAAPPEAETTHRFVWRADAVEFASWRGWEPYPPASGTLLDAFTYTGPDVPPAGAERMFFNVWLFLGPPLGTGGQELVVRSFAFR